VFYPNERFPFTRALEAGWETARQELLDLEDAQFLDWPERHLYGEGWSVFGLYSFGIKLDKNCRLCPRTARLVEQVPNLVTAGFSRMLAGTHIQPHTGYPEGLLRCHLGLVIPDRCAIRVGDWTRSWREGQCLVFDDTVEHEAWNESDRPRVVLLLDFRAPHLVVNPPRRRKKAGLLARLAARIGG
jgi:beta-hydroxylase